MSVRGDYKTTRTRCKAILDSEEAKGREAQARTLAFDTDLTPEQAIAVLKTGAKAAAAGGVFAAAMTAGGNPKVGDGGGNKDETDETAAKRIVSFHPNFKTGAKATAAGGVGDGGGNEEETDDQAAKRFVSYHPNFKRSA